MAWSTLYLSESLNNPRFLRVNGVACSHATPVFHRYCKTGIQE